MVGERGRSQPLKPPFPEFAVKFSREIRGLTLKIPVTQL